MLTGAFNGFAGGRYPDLVSAFFLLVMTVAALITVYEAPTVRSAVLVTVVGASAVFYHSVATLYAAVLFVLVALICLPYLLRGRHRPETRALLLSLAGVAVLSACYAIYVYNPGGILGGKSSTGGAVSIVLGSQAPASQGALLKELGPPIVWFGHTRGRRARGEPALPAPPGTGAHRRHRRRLVRGDVPGQPDVAGRVPAAVRA